MPHMPVYLLHYQKVQVSQDIYCCPKCNTHVVFQIFWDSYTTSDPCKPFHIQLSECYELNVPYIHLFWKCPLHLVVLTEPGSSQGHCFLLKGWLYYYFCLMWIDSGYGGEWSILNQFSFLLPTHFSFLSQKSISLKEPIRTFPYSPSLSSSLNLLVTLLLVEYLALFSSSPPLLLLLGTLPFIYLILWLLRWINCCY